MLMMNGKIVSTSDQIKEMTIEEYSNLDVDVRGDGSTYFIKNADSANDYKKLIRVSNILGDDVKLQGYADNTIIGAIIDLNQRLGGLSFKRNPETGEVEFVYSSEIPKPVEPIHTIKNFTDHEKIEHFEKILGDESSLNSIGFNTIVSAIKSLYARLGGITMHYDDNTNELKMIYNDNTPK